MIKMSVWPTNEVAGKCCKCHCEEGLGARRENSIRMRGGTPACPTESQLTTRPVDLDVNHTGLNKSINPRKKYC